MVLSFESKNILVFGATGYIGKEITQKLIDSKSSFEQISIFTSPTTAEKKKREIAVLKDQGVAVIVGDLKNEENVRAALKNVDTVISAVGRGAIGQQLTLARLSSESSSVKRFFPSEYGTDVAYWHSSASEAIHQPKLQVRALLEKLPDLDYTCIVTGPYADAESPAFLSALPSAPQIGSFNVLTRTAVIAGDGESLISFTTLDDVARFVVAAVKNPPEPSRHILRVCSFTTTPRAILDEFERQCGGQKWNVSYLPLEDLKRLEREAFENKVQIAAIYTLRRIWTEGGSLFEKPDNEAFGIREKGNLADAVGCAIKTQLSSQGDISSDRQFQ